MLEVGRLSIVPTVRVGAGRQECCRNPNAWPGFDGNREGVEEWGASKIGVASSAMDRDTLRTSG